MARSCDHIYVAESRTPQGNGYVLVAYRCGRCGDSFTSTERE
jgi:hypothetical protein